MNLELEVLIRLLITLLDSRSNNFLKTLFRAPIWGSFFNIYNGIHLK